MALRLLLTADWQADLTNLDLQEQMLEELLAHVAVFKPEAVINAGDLKEPYSPVHVAVMRFLVRSTQRIRKAGCRYVINLGNHDRESQSEHAHDTLDIVKAAGAEIARVPKVFEFAGGAKVACLPYTAGVEDAQRLWRSLSRDAQVPRVCIFHHEVFGAVINNMGTAAVGATIEELCLDKYDVALGGHLHRRQTLTDTVGYIGSPFCHSWSEANESKGFLELTL